VRSRTLTAFLSCFAIAAAVVACDDQSIDVPESTFPEPNDFTRQIAGRVLRGTEPVEGALVRADPTVPETEVFVDPVLVSRSATTDPFGAYRVQFAPRLYDFSVRDRRDAFVFTGVSTRYFEFQLGSDAPLRGFTARVVPTIQPPPAFGNSVAYFVSGEDARTLRPAADQSGSLEVVFRRFDTKVLLHAIEYVTSRGLAAAVREGRREIGVTTGGLVAIPIVTLEVSTKNTIAFDATPPPDYALTPLDVIMDLGLRTSAQPVARLAAGQPLEIGVVPGARYFVRGVASGRGASSDSGYAIFDPASPRFTLPLPYPISVVAPVDDMAQPPPGDVILDTGADLAARLSTGSVVHSLAPVAAGEGLIEIATTSRSTKLVDVTRLGLPRPTGRYLWSVQYFPNARTIVGLAGADARVFQPSSRTVSRVVVLR